MSQEAGHNTYLCHTVITTGYGIASGSSVDSPYPKGTIHLQRPYFLKAGIPMTHFYDGTLNLDISPKTFKILQPDFVVQQVNWIDDITEDFSFIRCKLLTKKREIDGLIYYPHPETKPAHFHCNQILEVLAPYIPTIKPGYHLDLAVDRAKLKLSNR